MRERRCPFSLTSWRTVSPWPRIALRAIVPRRSLRGPAVQSSRGHACSVGFSFNDGGMHPGEQLPRNCHGGRFATCAFGDPQEDSLHVLVVADGRPGRLLQYPPQVARSRLGDVSYPLFTTRGVDARIETRVAADRLGPSESPEVADFGNHRGGRDERHAWEAGQDSIDLTKKIPSYHFTHRSFHLGDLPLGESERIKALPKHLHVPGRQLLSLGLEVTNQSIALHACGARPVVGIHDRLHPMQDASVLPREAVAVAR